MNTNNLSKIIITFSNHFHDSFNFTKEDIGKAIYVGDEKVGSITDITEDFVYGEVDIDKWHFINTRACSLEFIYKGEQDGQQ